jgi:hypothetical protein
MTYLNKRVEVKIPQRGNDGKLNGKYTTVVGICQSEPQENKNLGVSLQVVVDRMPVTIKSLNDIKIL